MIAIKICIWNKTKKQIPNKKPTQSDKSFFFGQLSDKYVPLMIAYSTGVTI